MMPSIKGIVLSKEAMDKTEILKRRFREQLDILSNGAEGKSNWNIEQTQQAANTFMNSKKGTSSTPGHQDLSDKNPFQIESPEIFRPPLP